MASPAAHQRADRYGWRILVSLAALLLAGFLVDRLVDWLWMGQLGYRQIFWRILAVELALFAAAFVPLGLYFWLSTRAMLRSAVDWQAAGGYGLAELLGDRAQSSLLRLGVPVVLAVVFALSVSAAWDETLRFFFGGSFGRSEPVLGLDTGFYVFRLPLIDAVTKVFLLATSLTLAAQVALHYAMGLFGAWGSLDGRQRHRIVGLLAWNVIAVAAAGGIGYALERYRLLHAAAGTVVGPGFTDANVVMPALWLMAGVMAAVIIVGLFAVRRGHAGYLAGAVVGAAVTHALALWVAPGLVQSFIVDPSEFKREKTYLEHNIAFTREAFALDSIAERPYAGTAELSLADIEESRDTIRNIRLWDYRPLLRTLRQIQQIRLYYQFYDVDVDRYQLADGYRQVLLSARELTPGLPERADTWVNRHLQYTHGYGLAMSLAAQEGGQGSPSLIVRDLPPESRRGVEVDQPAIYFGEHMSGFRIVPSGLQEFDYPKGDENVYVSYQGEGGVPVGSFWRRLLFAVQQFDISILLTDYITADSRIQIRRPLQERIREVTPFLKLDRDPYLVIAEGRLFWIQDAYTTSDRFPYSESHNLREAARRDDPGVWRGEPVNYIRNSVKVVVDAYNGSVSFYAMEPDEPVLAAYGNAFPGFLKPLSALPAGLKSHLRYPQDLFQAQIARYAAYHMRDPQVFYNNEDLWTIPQEKYGGSAITMEPYYILMRLPGEERLQFMLMQPLTPAGRNNMIAWVAARADFPDYGEVVAFKLPKERLIFGPMQVEALVDQDTAISRQLSLWDQRGSRVIRGNLLAIPIDRSLIYVEPVYLVAEEGDVPQLKRVIVAHGDRVAMEPTLDRAIQALFGDGAPRPAAAEAALPAPALMSTIRQRIEDAEAALSRGDWGAFGQAMERLKQAIPPAEGDGDGNSPDGS
jgi:uncharacterized membrane protein (UPF0182 family)